MLFHGSVTTLVSSLHYLRIKITYTFVLLLFLTWYSSHQVNSSESLLELEWEWSKLEFVFPSEETKQEAIEKGYYIPEPISNVPLDVDVHYTENGRRVFITVPRFDYGVPITFGTLDDEGRIHAYPDYSWHDNQGENCDGLTSVFRTAIDKCNRLWVLDAGTLDVMHCTPQLLAFDLNNDKLIYRHRFSNSSYTKNSLYITPVVDVRDEACSDTFVYAADGKSFTLGVVDVAKDKSWHATHRLFYPNPLAGSFNIDGIHFDLMDGLFGMALSPLENGDRNLYFHALASFNENVVKTSVIQNSNFIKHPAADPNNINVLLPGERPSQSAAEAMDSKGILYYGIANPPSIWCWNSKTEFSSENFHLIAINEKTLQFASGVKVIKKNDEEETLWIVTSSFQRVASGTMNANETNFRVHSGSLTEIWKQSSCAF